MKKARARDLRQDAPTGALERARALNMLGAFREAVALGVKATAGLRTAGDAAQEALVWLEAAWAETYLGDLKQAEAYLARAGRACPGIEQLPETGARAEWIRARILRERGEYAPAFEGFERIRHELLARGNREDAARVLREIGQTRTRLKPGEAFAPLRGARRFFARSGMRFDVAYTDIALGIALMETGKPGRARTRYRRAREVFEEFGSVFFGAWCELELGLLEVEAERFAEALVYFQTARRAFIQVGASQESSSCEVNLGWTLIKLNRYEEAREYLEHAARMAQATGRQIKVAVCYANLGLIREKQGHYALALEYHQRAHTIFVRKHAGERQADSELDLGQLYWRLGDYPKALRYLTNASRLYRRQGKLTANAQCELYQAHILVELGKTKRAAEALRRMRRQFIKQGATTSQAICERALARVKADDKRGALGYIHSARRLFQEKKSYIDAALCDLIQAELELEWGEWGEAHALLNRAAKGLGAGMRDQRWRIAFGLAQVAEAQDDLARARELYVQGAAGLAELQGALRLEDLSNTAFGVRRTGLDAAVAFLAEHDFVEDALLCVESAKARTFNQTLAARTRQGRGGRAKHLPKDAREMERLQGELEQARAALLAVPDEEPRQATVREGSRVQFVRARQRLEALEEAYERAAAQHRLAHKGLSGASGVGRFQLQAFRKVASAKLGRGWSALDYYFANGQLYRLWITNETLRLDAVTWSEWDQRMLRDCASTNRDLRKLVYQHADQNSGVASFASRALDDLTARLVPAELLSQNGEQTLLIAPHGLLHQLPFQALRWNGQPLLERFTIQYTPNLQAFTQLAGTRTRRGKKRWLLYGLGEFGRRAGELEFTRTEIDHLAKLAPAESVVRWQENATRTQLMDRNARGALEPFEVLHFATHAVSEPGAPHTSRIMLADRDLTVLDVMDLSLDAELVTLSGCSSGIAKGGSGDEWLGLPRAFFYAGARTIVASLWQVEDESTVKLMQGFYAELARGETSARALQRAQLTLHEQGYAPYQWAPFMVMGAG